MKILSAEQIKSADRYTIEQEPITSLALMERAASRLTQKILRDYRHLHHFIVFCGTGNNGGDGLVIARHLIHEGKRVEVFILDSPHHSQEFTENLVKLNGFLSLKLLYIQSEDDFPRLEEKDIIIDALFGTGLSRPLSGLSEQLVLHINNARSETISVDIPSGMFADKHSSGVMIEADKVYTFQLPKLAFLLPENGYAVSKWDLVDIGLSEKFIEEAVSPYYFLDAKVVKSLYKTRQKFSHKGVFGHAIMIGGSKGKIGAAVLASKACLRSGAGLVTVQVPKVGYSILQTTIPEVMVEEDDGADYITTSHDLSTYNSIGIGMGLGVASPTIQIFKNLLKQYGQPKVIDADAINLLAQDFGLNYLLKDCILTPHPGEFRRLVGEWENDFERLEKQIDFAKKFGCVLIVKGAHTSIAMPDGRVYFNSTGNNGMATAGSGDVLTGLLTGLLAQGYHMEEAALLGVYLHGLAGNLALEKQSKESLIASDIIDNIGQAFKEIKPQ
ncbi:MAG: NAD(P)H-hydrate dehydratase [Chitinophagales bacterium]|nr:NAD(P)H-hydrate dehydratase [Chitinophagales bacterium]